MSKLDELIKELCPNGVEYKELGKVLDYIQPTKYIVESTEYKDEYNIPVLTAGQTFILGYTDETKGIYEASKENPVIIFDDFTGSMHWINFKFKIKSSAMKIIIPRANETLNFKYFYYLLKNIKYSSETHTRLWISVFSKFLVPVPPLEVQHEIVRILDNYTKSVEELKEKLKEELIARKKQYSWYRDYLLKFENKVKIVKLGELFEFKNGINKEKSSFGKGTPIINYVNVYKKNKIYFEDLQGLVEATDDELIRYKVKRGDVFFTRTSETIEEIGFTSVLLEDIENCVFSGFLLRARPLTDLLLPEYCAYCFSTSSMRNAIKRKSTYTTRALINGTSLSQIEISLSPLEVQKRIVEVLDNFEKTCKELNIELSSEIEIKQKEYEFIRNYLLTFNNEEVYALSKQASKQASPKSN